MSDWLPEEIMAWTQQGLAASIRNTVRDLNTLVACAHKRELVVNFRIKQHEDSSPKIIVQVTQEV